MFMTSKPSLLRALLTAAAVLSLHTACSNESRTEPFTEPHDIPDRFRDFSQHLESELQTLGIPGAAVAILEHGELSFARGFGTKGHFSSEPVQAETIFRTGSMGKVVTALGVLSAVDDGLLDLDAPPQFTKVEQSSQTPSRTGLRVFTGTVPDYTAEVKGLLLGGVVAGGPAEQAGLQKGDVIVEISGQSIANIYDYTFALELLKVDQPVKVVYTRGGKRIETTLTPTVRR